MTAEIENLILEHLRALRGDIAELRRDSTEIKERLTRVELGLAAILVECR